MNKQQIEALFPLEAWITPAIIELADVDDIHKCIGALTLKSVLGYDSDVSWADLRGSIHFDNDEYLVIGTLEKVHMMEVTEPQKVTFIIRY